MSKMTTFSISFTLILSTISLCLCQNVPVDMLKMTPDPENSAGSHSMKMPDSASLEVSDLDSMEMMKSHAPLVKDMTIKEFMEMLHPSSMDTTEEDDLLNMPPPASMTIAGPLRSGFPIGMGNFVMQGKPHSSEEDRMPSFDNGIIMNSNMPMLLNAQTGRGRFGISNFNIGRIR